MQKYYFTGHQSINQSINQSNQSLFTLKTKPWQGSEAKSNEQ